MGDNLDFSVDNYSLEDLLEIFGIEGPIPQNEIIERGSKMIEKYRQAKKPEHVTFFSTATNKLLSNYQNIETFLNRVPEEEDDSDSEEDDESLDGKEGFVGGHSPNANSGGDTNYVINVGGDKKHMLPAENVLKNNLYNTQSTRNTMNNYMMPQRTANVKVPVNLDHSVQLPKKLLLPNSYSQVPYLQGTMNPTLQNTYLTWVNVDGQFREIVTNTQNSTSCDTGGTGAIMQKDSPTDFMFTLNSPVTNVLSMTLASLEVPLNGYNAFSKQNGNLSFDVSFNWKAPGEIQVRTVVGWWVQDISGILQGLPIGLEPRLPQKFQIATDCGVATGGCTIYQQKPICAQTDDMWREWGTGPSPPGTGGWMPGPTFWGQHPPEHAYQTGATGYDNSGKELGNCCDNTYSSNTWNASHFSWGYAPCYVGPDVCWQCLPFTGPSTDYTGVTGILLPLWCEIEDEPLQQAFIGTWTGPTGTTNWCCDTVGGCPASINGTCAATGATSSPNETGPCPCCYCWTPAVSNSGRGPGGGPPESTVPSCLTRYFWDTGTKGPPYTHDDVDKYSCGNTSRDREACCTCAGAGCAHCEKTKFSELNQVVDSSGNIAVYIPTSDVSGTTILEEPDQYICTEIPEGNYGNSLSTAGVNITEYLNASLLSILGPIPDDPNNPTEIIEKYASIIDGTGSNDLLYIKAFQNQGDSKITIALNGSFDWWINLMEPLEVPVQTYRHGYRKTTRFHSSAFNVFGNAMPAAPYPYPSYNPKVDPPTVIAATGPNYDWQTNNAFAIPRATYGWWDDRIQKSECCSTGPCGTGGPCGLWGHDFDPGELLTIMQSYTACTGICWLVNDGKPNTGCGYPLAVGAGYWQPGLSARPIEWGSLPTGDEPPPPVQWVSQQDIFGQGDLPSVPPLPTPYQQKRYGSGYPNLKPLDIKEYPDPEWDPYRRQLIYPQNPASTCPFAPHGTNPNGVDYNRGGGNPGSRGDAYKQVVRARAEAEAWSPDIFGNFIYCWNEIVCNWGNTDVYNSFASKKWTDDAGVPQHLQPPVEKPDPTFEEFLQQQPGYHDLTLNGGFGTIPPVVFVDGETIQHDAYMGKPAGMGNEFDPRTLMGYWPGTCVPSCMLDRMLTIMQQNTKDYSGCKLIPNKGIWNPFEDTNVPPPYNNDPDQYPHNCTDADDKCGIPSFQLNQVQIYVLYYIHLVLIPHAYKSYKTWLRATMEFMGDLPTKDYLDVTLQKTQQWLWLGGFMNMYTGADAKLNKNWIIEKHPHWPDDVKNNWNNLNAMPVLPWPFPFTFNWDAYLPHRTWPHPKSGPVRTPPDPYKPNDVWAFAVSPGFDMTLPQFDIQWYNPNGPFMCGKAKCDPAPGATRAGYGSNQHNVNPGRKLNRNLGWYLGFKENISEPTIQSLITDYSTGLYEPTFVKFALLNSGSLDKNGVVSGAPPWIYYTLTGCLQLDSLVKMKEARAFAYTQHLNYKNTYNNLFQSPPDGIGTIDHAYAFMHPPYSTDFANRVAAGAFPSYAEYQSEYGEYVPLVPDVEIPAAKSAAAHACSTQTACHEICGLLWYGMKAECLANLNGTNYMTLIIDDYIQNRYNGNMPAFAAPHQTFKTPSYAKRYESSMPICKDKNGRVVFRDGKHGPITIARKCRQGTPNPNDIIDGSNNLTQAQKWTAKQIALRQKLPPQNMVVSPTLSNVLIRVPVDREQLSAGGLLVIKPNYSTASGGRGTGRRYYGPVTLKRFHIQLVDDIGVPINLNCGNISFCLLLERLYQY